MFSENEIVIFLEKAEVKKLVNEARKEFILHEARCMEISNHDFLSLIFMTPSLGIALANGNVSLMEELTLNRMARRMSKGDYFLKQDPVVHAMSFFIRHYNNWEERFLKIIKLVLDEHLDFEQVKLLEPAGYKDPVKRLTGVLLHVPFIMVNFLTSFLLHEETNISTRRCIFKLEYKKIVSLGDQLELSDLPVFKTFLETFTLK